MAFHYGNPSKHTHHVLQRSKPPYICEQLADEETEAQTQGLTDWHDKLTIRIAAIGLTSAFPEEKKYLPVKYIYQL